MARKSQWEKGVELYKAELIEDIAERLAYESLSFEDFKNLDFWKQLEVMYGASFKHEVEEKRKRGGIIDPVYNAAQHCSSGGGSYIYNGDIVERLCTPSEIKRYKAGKLWKIDWIEEQGRALYQAGEMILREAAR